VRLCRSLVGAEFPITFSDRAARILGPGMLPPIALHLSIYKALVNDVVNRNDNDMYDHMNNSVYNFL
jgi:hypothetical protein